MKGGCEEKLLMLQERTKQEIETCPKNVSHDDHDVPIQSQHYPLDHHISCGNELLATTTKEIVKGRENATTCQSASSKRSSRSVLEQKRTHKVGSATPDE